MLRAAALAAAAIAIPVAARHAVLMPDPRAPAWHAEAMGLAAGILAALALSAWGIRFWLRQDAARATPAGQAVRDYLPGVVCLCGAWLLLALRLPTLLVGEMTSDTAQGIFWAAFTGHAGTGATVEGAGMAWLPSTVAAAAHAMGAAAAAVPHIYQTAACVFWGVCVSAFAWPMFRRVLPSDLARVMICVALACQPDYTLKTLAHVGVYAAVPTLLCLWYVIATPALTLRAALVCGACALAGTLMHPSGAAFAAAFACVGAVASWQKNTARAAFCALGLAGAGAQVWVLALWDRALGAQVVGDAPGRLLTAARVSALLPVWGVGGKASLGMPTGDAGAYVVWLCAIGAALLALLQTSAEQHRGRWFAMAAVALLTAAAAVACEVLVAPETAALLAAGEQHAALATAAWFVPCVAVFLALATGIGGSALNRHVPWALGLWLFAGYPFGVGGLPQVPLWPTRGFSAWQALAPRVLGPREARGCIPLDPFPAYLGMDCQLLHSVGSATGLGGWMTFFHEVPLTPPAPADGWSVDSIGIAFNKTPPLDAAPWEIPVSMVALDAQGAEIARTSATFQPPEIFTWFTFAPPLLRAAKIKLQIAPGTSLAMGIESQQTREPFWVWFGRGEPEEGGEGVHLAGP